ncbi:MAG: hypothetical protein K0U29_00870 [Gammaproteobacteria bacterium]|nr:hypothetical protein [Gammaproteobacteria bacterium]
MNDRQQFKSHNDSYYQNPAGEIKRAIIELQESAKWRKNWDTFNDAMVYEKGKPSFDQVIGSLEKISEIALVSLEK